MYTIRKANLSFGGPPLLDDAQFTIHKGDRIALIGRNGEGKSSLMKVIAGIIPADSAEVERHPSLKIAYLQQEVPDILDGSVREVVLQGAGPNAHLEKEYHRASLELETADSQSSEAIMETMSALQSEMEVHGVWDLARKVDRLLETLRIDGELKFSSLSGGLKRRVILGRELIKEPDLILLDEPTNHLDFTSITWLEDLLCSIEATILFVTHDRAFLEKVATRILELDRGKLTCFDCNYPTYQKRKSELIDSEAKAAAVFDKKLAQEEAWIRQGIKARRTRNEGRVRALEKLRQIRSERRDLGSNAQFNIEQAHASGRKVIEVENLSYNWGDQPIVKGLSTTIWRGDKIGLIGPNGCGKTTLIQLLLKKIAPDSGWIKHGTKIESRYFDQYREQLDPQATLRSVVAGDEEWVTVGDQKRHIYSYLSDFLFAPDQAKGKVSALSGGEKNRLLLAKLFAKHSNLLVLDEPTNDLDLETLELLEELLLNYSGTLILVSHDRQFLNSVVTQTLAFEGNGVIRETVGGYDEYEREASRDIPQTKSAKPKGTGSKTEQTEKTRFRTNREHWELELIPDKISHIEATCETLTAQLSDLKVVSDPSKLSEIQTKLSASESEIDTLMQRWESIEMIPINPKKPIPKNPNT
jgi:ATP-binding cassette subfamily F protein uup